jgi:hypothetical protein
VEQISDDGTYASFASELLRERGLAIDEPVIQQLIWLDLEGDGIHEVLVVAGDTAAETKNTFGQALPGDYSLAFLRRITDSGVETWLLAESVSTETEPGYWSTFAVSGVADLRAIRRWRSSSLVLPGRAAGSPCLSTSMTPSALMP